jgi:hypothetical protein
VSPVGPLAADPGNAPLVLVAAPAAIVLMLGATTVIGVVKPWGRITRGDGGPEDAA